jgi:sugar phosphate isomerase/epimerase
MFLGRRLDREVLKGIASSGIGRLELFMQRPHFDPADPEQVKMLAADAEAAGVELISAHAPIYRERLKDKVARKLHTLSLCDPDPTRREFAVKELFNAVEASGALGISNLVVHTGLLGENAATDPALEIETCVESLHMPAARAAALGVNLALENGTAPGVTVRVLNEVLARMDMPNLGLCLDVGHSNLYGNPHADVREARQYLFSLHLHDNDGNDDMHLLPGVGTADFFDVIAFLRSSKFMGITTMEVGAEPLANPAALDPLLDHAGLVASLIADFERGLVPRKMLQSN